jgi:hypothetical protein
MTPKRSTRNDANPAEQLARYRAWATHLEGVRADYIRRTPLYRWGFFALTAAGFACFAGGTFMGLWGAGSASFVSVCGLVMLRVRIWEIDVEIGEMRDEIRHLERVSASEGA